MIHRATSAKRGGKHRIQKFIKQEGQTRVRGGNIADMSKGDEKNIDHDVDVMGREGDRAVFGARKGRRMSWTMSASVGKLKN